MRNLDEYPVTYEEAFRLLNGYKTEVVSVPLEEKRVGDMTASIIDWIEEQLHRLQQFDK